jgi:hypothetical protein
MYHSIVQISADESIELNWEKNWTNFALLQDGQIIGKIPTKAELIAARNIRTKSGKILTPVLRDGQLEIWYNGKDLVSGMGNGSQNYFGMACKTMHFVGGGLTIFGFILLLDVYRAASLVVIPLGLLFLGLARKADKTGNLLYLKIGFGILQFIPIGGYLGRSIRQEINKGISEPAGNRLDIKEK